MIPLPLLRPLAALVLVAPLLGCPEPPREVRRSADLVLDEGLTSDRDLPLRGLASCAFESRWALTLHPGEEVTVLVEVGAGSELVLGGCISRPRGGAEPGGGNLAVIVEPAGGEAVTAEVAVPRYSRRWGERLELGDLPAVPARLRLRADLPAGRRLYLWDAVLERRASVPPPARGERPPQLLLISADTLREDAIAALGGTTPTPHLDRLVAASQAFTPHYAAASWTQPSHGSLLTGQSPEVHGVGRGESRIHPGVPTLAERFRDAGFLTAGLVHDVVWLAPRFGFSRGFDRYREVHWTTPQMVRHAAEWMLEHREEPFFYFLHSFEVHSDFRSLPYEAPGLTPRRVGERFGVEDYGCRDRQCASQLLFALREGRLEPLDGEGEILRYTYDAGVAHLDAALGELFDRLAEAGMLDSMMIVLTSDHGESFLEHPEAVLHGLFWEEVIRVPLIIKWPGGRAAGERQATPSSALDVAPTLLTAYKLEGAAELPGRDLAAPGRPRPVFSWGPWTAVRAGDAKAVMLPGDLADQLYDLAVDPGEERDLAAERPEEIARLERLAESRRALDARILEQIGEGGAEATRGLSAEERKRLEALGYLGGDG